MARKTTICKTTPEPSADLRLKPVKSQLESFGKARPGDMPILEMLKVYCQEALEQYRDDPMRKMDAIGKLLTHGKKAYDMKMRLNKDITV